MPISSRTPARRRAALLLEVIVALAIMVAAMAMLGTQLVGGLQLTAEADQQTRATELCDRILALLELDPATAERVFLDRQTSGDFGKQYPGYFWRAFVEPTDVEGLGQVNIEILHQPDQAEIDDIDTARVVRRIHLLKADPGRINLEKDFGFNEEQIAQFTGTIPIPGLDPNNIDPQSLVSLDPEQLLAILPALLPLIQQMLGGAPLPDDLQNMTPDQIRQFIEDAVANQGGIPGEIPGDQPPGFDGLSPGLGDFPPGAGPRGGRRGNRPGGAPPAPGSAEDLERQIRDAVDAQGGFANPPRAPGGPGGRGGRPGGGQRPPAPPRNPGGAAGVQPSGVGPNGEPQYTIEDLYRLRELLEQQQGAGE